MRRAAALAVVTLCLTGAACQTTKVGFPDAADVNASVATKPKPTADILTPSGSARYNEKLEAWGDGIWAASGRICRFLAERGMEDIACPARPAQEN